MDKRQGYSKAPAVCTSNLREEFEVEEYKESEFPF